MTIRELCEKEVVRLEQGVCLGRADDLAFDPATARLQSLILLGRPRLFDHTNHHHAFAGCTPFCSIICKEYNLTASC